ncbi:MAG TPA: alpha/beta fold hydrolase [Steroidobacteraceae bacterium]|nr:alpha/beta fold hydrolase [Steroidobacteraceae bacterium]
MEPRRGGQQPGGSALADRALSAPAPAGAYEPPGWLRNAHLQSSLDSLPPRHGWARRRARALLDGAHELLLECGEGVRLQGHYSAPRPGGFSSGTPRLAVLLHGWEGSAESSQVLSAGALLLARGYGMVRLNLRDHGATHHLNREIFHSCRLPEVVGALCALRAQFPAARLYLAGYSLGGNFVLRAAASPGAPAGIACAVAVSPVLDPAATLLALERAWPLYRRFFVSRWSASLRRKQRAWPDAHDFEPQLRLADLRAMTAALVRTSTDFPSLEAYLDGYALTGSRLAGLRVPAWLLLAEDDPIIPAADLARLAQPEGLEIATTSHGGHCGFIDHLRGPSFADRMIVEQFARHP